MCGSSFIKLYLRFLSLAIIKAYCRQRQHSLSCHCVCWDLTILDWQFLSFVCGPLHFNLRRENTCVKSWDRTWIPQLYNELLLPPDYQATGYSLDSLKCSTPETMLVQVRLKSRCLLIIRAQTGSVRSTKDSSVPMPPKASQNVQL